MMRENATAYMEILAVNGMIKGHVTRLLVVIVFHSPQSFWQTNQKREFFAYVHRVERDGLARSSKDEITRAGRGGTEPRFTHSTTSRRHLQVYIIN